MIVKKHIHFAIIRFYDLSILKLYERNLGKMIGNILSSYPNKYINVYKKLMLMEVDGSNMVRTFFSFSPEVQKKTLLLSS